MTGITEAAQGLLYPDKKYVVVPEVADGFVKLPNSSSRFIRQWPELTSLLVASAKVNPANFLHMALVYDQSLSLARDVFLLFPRINYQSQRQIISELGFAMVHDLGKVWVGRDFDESRVLVHPTDIRSRPTAHNGYHWAHPTFSAIMLNSLAQPEREPLAQSLKSWSRQSLLHHRDYMPFAEVGDSRSMHSMTKEAWIAHFLFSVSDVAVAMKMDRPNGQGNHVDEKITQVLMRKHLSNNNLRLFLGEDVDPSLLRPYLLASCMRQLSVLRETYSPQDCTQPEGFVAEGFSVDCRKDTVEVDWLARMSQNLWRTHKRELMAPIVRMDTAGVLQIR